MRKLSALILAMSAMTLHAKSIEVINYSEPTDIIVKIRPGHMGKFLAKKSLMGVDVRKELRLLTGEFLLVKGEGDMKSLVQDFNEMPEVEYSEPNYRYRSQMDFSSIKKMIPFNLDRSSTDARQDPLYQWQWGLNNRGDNEPSSEKIESRGIAGADLSAEAAWSITRGSRKVIVGVVDSGLDVNHPDLKNNIWVNKNEIPGNGIDDDHNGYIDDVYGWSGLTHNGDLSDGTGHGTHCAGTIGAEHDNGVGISGVMGEVSIMGLKFIDSQGWGSTADAIEVIDYAVRMNVDVLSNSWGGGPYSKALEDIIRKARDRGVLFVAAAGNLSSNNDYNTYYPANYNFSNVISVANHTAKDELGIYSNYGVSTVHIAAPGTNILSTIPNGYGVRSGTSMAAPYVAGALGLLISKEGRLPVGEAKRRLMNSSVKTTSYQGKIISGGRLNLYQLLIK